MSLPQLKTRCPFFFSHRTTMLVSADQLFFCGVFRIFCSRLMLLLLLVLVVHGLPTNEKDAVAKRRNEWSQRFAFSVRTKRVWELLQRIDTTTKPYYVASCARINNEAHGMYEWLIHCMLNGVNHVYVLDNSLSGFDAKEVLQPFVDVGYVSYFVRSADVMLSHPFYLYKQAHVRPRRPMDVHWIADECLQTFRNEMVWMLANDADEFIVPPVGMSLSQYLRKIENTTDAIEITWRLMKPMGTWASSDVPIRSLAYTEQCEEMTRDGARNCKHPKTIIKAALAGRFDYKDQPTVNRAARKLILHCGDEIEYIHFYYKTLEEILSKRHRGDHVIRVKGSRSDVQEVVIRANAYCRSDNSSLNPKLAAFVKPIPYYMKDLPYVPYRRLTASCPPSIPYPPGQEPRLEKKHLYLESKFDHCMRFSEQKYLKHAPSICLRRKPKRPLLFDFILKCRFYGNLSRFDVFFEPWVGCEPPPPCPIDWTEGEANPTTSGISTLPFYPTSQSHIPTRRHIHSKRTEQKLSGSSH